MPFVGALGRHPRAILRVLEVVCVIVLVLAFLSVSLQRKYNGTVADIQQSRVDITWNTCQSQDMRHDNTIIQLDRQLLLALKQKPKGTTIEKLEAQIAAVRGKSALGSRLVQTHDFTVLLIEALAPHVDCENQLVQRFGRDHLKPSSL